MSRAHLRIPSTANIDLSGATLSTTPPNDNQLSTGSLSGTNTDDVTIPAGAAYVYIKNIGGLTPDDITVNGRTISPNGEFERERNFDGINRDLLPAYVIVKNGSLAEVYYEV